MKLNIGKKIQRLRIEKGYTQEDLATRCAISSAAVSKWENSQSYPDITTLPILARIFHITIDELLDFEETIDESTIDCMMNDILQAFQKSYEEGMKVCKELLYTYPNSELLKLKIIGSHVRISMCLYQDPNVETYLKEFQTFAKQMCKTLINSDDFMIRQSACILYSNFAQTKEEMQESLSYIQALPKSMSTTSIESSLYLMLEEYTQANHMLQTQLYQDCSNIILYFLSLIQVAIKEEQTKDAYELLQQCERFNDTMKLQSTVIPQLCFQYAQLKDEDNTLRLLKQYIEQAKNFDTLFSSIYTSLPSVPWFSTLKLKENAMPKGVMKHNLIDMLQKTDELSFLYDHEEYKKIVRDFENEIQH